MCTVNEKGYKFKSGRTMKDFKLSELTKEEALELYDTPANAMDLHHIRENLHDLRTDVQSTNNLLTETLDEMQKHTSNCPINKVKVNEMILENFDSPAHKRFLEERWVEILSDKIITTGNVAKALITMALFLSAIGGVVYAVGKL